MTRTALARCAAAGVLALAACAHNGGLPESGASGETSMFKFTGKRPRDLGVEGGKFRAARTAKPNWVSSQVETGDPHYVAPLKLAGDCRSALQRLAQVIQAQPRTAIVEQKDSYLYAEFSTALMGYTDDVEFHCDGKAIHVRSSSRLGHSDLGANRKRVEALRAAFEK